MGTSTWGAVHAAPMKPVLRTLFGLVLCTQVLTGQVERAPSWLQICGGSYLFSEDSISWIEAADYCDLFASHLVQIDSREENDCLLTEAVARQLNGEYWHSANDIEVEGVIRQGNGSSVVWGPRWRQGQNAIMAPSGGQSENCFEIYISTDNNAGKWNDDRCDRYLKYICER